MFKLYYLYFNFSFSHYKYFRIKNSLEIGIYENYEVVWAISHRVGQW